MKLLRKILLLSTLLLAQYAAGQPAFHTAIYKPNIHTLRLKYADIEDVERPFLVLGDDDYRLDISFDEMSHSTHLYTYTLLHLNQDFTLSGLQQTEYLDGFTTADITDIEHSSLTQTLYTHYRFEFPNDDMRPKVSGNYALKIYEDGNPDDVVAVVTFQVAEQDIEVSAHIRSNTDIEFNNRYQQLDLDINLRDHSIRTPDEITVRVMQNNRTDNQVTLNRPTFINGNRLEYKNNRALIFEGGNEYRRFDISSEYIKGRGVDRIDFDRNDYHAFLFPDVNTATAPYVSELDADGQYVVNAERRDDDDFEADYMYVYFLLPQPTPWFNGTVYVNGDFTFNSLQPDYAMQYDSEHKCYVYHAFLKQGAYEYQYLFREKGKSAGSTFLIEGSHWQTENEYTVLVYYRPFDGRYDRLLGIRRFK